MASRQALISAVIARTDVFEAAERAGHTDLDMLIIGITDAEADCYTAGLIDSDIWGEMTDTAIEL